jgi:hypothetical protein
MKIAQIQEGIKFSTADYSSVLNDPKINIGYEIEFVAVTSAFKQETYLEVKSLSQLANSRYIIEKITQDFYVDWSKVKDFQKEYIQKWCEKYAQLGPKLSKTQLSKIIEEHIMVLKSDAAIEKITRDKQWATQEGRIQLLLNLWNSSPYMAKIAEWLQTLIIHGDMKIAEIFNRSAITPKNGWADAAHTKYYVNTQDDDDEYNEEVEAQVISQLNNLGLHGKVQTAPSLKDWQLTLDPSIHPQADKPGHGFELVSPPLEVHAALEDLKKVCDWMEANKHYTNTTTGFHVNVNWGDKAEMQAIDKLKVVLLMGEKYIMQLFNRTTNEFTQSHIEKLQGKIAQSGSKWKSDRDVQSLIARVNQLLDKQKYRTVNLDKLSNGYLEFRIMGGEDYHKRFEDVKKIMIRYAFVIKAALDPLAFQQEYEQELGKLISTALDQAQPKYPDLMTKYAVRGASTPKTHDAMLSYFQRAQQAFDRGDDDVAAKIMSILLSNADKQTYTDKLTAEDLNASSLSYRLLLKKYGWDTNRLVQAMTKAKVKPSVIAQAEHYLETY